MTWAAEEFATVELGDKRLNSRLVKLAEQLAAKPTASIPGACGGWGDTAAAYRMLDNERCDWREIIEAHGRCAGIYSPSPSRLADVKNTYKSMTYSWSSVSSRASQTDSCSIFKQIMRISPFLLRQVRLQPVDSQRLFRHRVEGE